MESGKTMNCRLFGLLFALALLSGGCASVPDDPEIRRDALPLMQGKTEGFFETVAPGAEGKFFLRSFGTVRLCYWQRSATERVWMLWTTARRERVPLMLDGSVFAVYGADGGKATLEIGGGGLSYAELTGEPLYVVGSPELMLEVRFPER